MPWLLGHLLPFEPSTNRIFRREFVILSNNLFNWFISHFSCYLIFNNQVILQRYYVAWSWICFQIFIQLAFLINISPNVSRKCHLSEQPIKSRVSFLIITTQYKSKVLSHCMRSGMSNRLNLVRSIFNKCYSFACICAIRIVNVSPHSFNVCRVVNVLNLIHIVSSNIASSEMIVSLSLPDSQGSVSHSDIIIFLMLSQSGNEVPGFILTGQHSLWINCKISCPKSISILLIDSFSRCFSIQHWFSLIKCIFMNSLVCLAWFKSNIYLLRNFIESSMECEHILRVSEIS